MAGESPDKSEQKQSSGETTTSERDPRIAVSHSPSPSGVPSGEDGAKTANGSGAGARTGSGPASGSASGSASAAVASAPGGVDQATAVFRAPRQEDGDSRLRAAVAAWVDQEAEPKDSASEGAASGPEDAARAEAPEPGPEFEDAKSSAPETETGRDADADEDGGPEPTAPEADEAGQAGAEPEAAEDSGTDTEAAAPKADDPAPATPGTKPEASDNAAAAAKSGAAGPRDAKADQAKADDTEADDEDAAPGARATSWGAKPTASEGGGSTPSEPKASPAKAESKAEPSDPKPGPAKAEPKADGASPSEAGAKPTEPKGIDHPTAVFKAPAPPAVDQPTAMLKLPAPKREPADGRTGDPAAERTSQFIPLRSDDAGPGTAAPKNPAAPAKNPSAPAQGFDAPVRKPEAPKVTPPPAAAPGPAPVIPERAERTRQQPLPPKPPLDLLAELTNTPPPPQTPVRTTVRRFKIWTPLVLLLLIVFAVVQIMRPLPDPKLTLTSSATYTFNGDALNLPWPAEGQSAVSVDGVGSLGTHGEQKPAPLASVAKTMTAYVILKGHPITGKQEGEKITVDQQAEDDAKKPDESTAPIRKDQQFTEKQMLELLMIPSGNNAARLLARWDAGSEEAFIAKMNDAAKELGMTSTTYTDPSGLKETTVSTPVDQLKLAQAVMQNDVFRGIVNTPQIKIPGIDTMIYNNNTILLKPGVSGIKTGSSTPAGGNLLWSADTVVDGKNQRIYGIVMGQRTGTTLDNKLKAAINNSYTLIQAVQKAVTSATVVKKGDVVGYVDDGLGGKTPLVAAKDLKAVGWPGLKVDVTLGAGGKPVPHSAKPGTVVGELSIGSGNGRLTAPVELKSALAEPGTGAKLTRLG
ncbi:serine hydrolase [Streptomyces violascens]|uniref:D-alanyl-D-alanine carboxypeptidase n=1 Tax=Streptomyces violascens TaxID=67381 RepID=A0ABQ3QMB3_9ACTN|nr:serine hydrolase [Streptomyces violascens]GGT99275.1 D-alanyl-D-alanine carboxypeptidase [Streptomyces violascens]GHI38412.1 D-alanyl-D-alanine carboxypeptidase [Streptomyces violascens]